MCTLALAWQQFADAPVVVAANRDEALDRPSDPPEKRSGSRSFVAPRDAEAGGTWIGVNDAGVFVGITNRWVSVDGGGERSRGLLVQDALDAPSAEEAARVVERAVTEHRYDGFNLVLADANAALLLEWDGRLNVQPLSPGVHVTVNVGTNGTFFEPERRPEMGPRQADNAGRVREALWPEPGETADSWTARASTVLGDHDYGVCIHENGPDGAYGTRSSSLVTVSASGDVDYAFAPGAPCETAYESLSFAPFGEDDGESQV